MKTTAARVSYMRDLENVRRLKEALGLDSNLDANVCAALTTACELVHGVIGAMGDTDTMHSLIASKTTKLQSIVGTMNAAKSSAGSHSR